MTSETLRNTLEQNRDNLKALLEALEADYELPDDPEKSARMASFFGASQERVKEAEMTDKERAAWLFEENAKAIAAAAEAAGAPSRKVNDDATTPASKFSGLFVPKSEARRHSQKQQVRSNREG